MAKRPDALKLLHPRRVLKMETREESQIPNQINWEKPDHSYTLRVADHRKRYSGTQPRTTTPSFKYNCHGLTFGSRRTHIKNSDVQQIIDEDEYAEIKSDQALPGDVIVYQSTESGEFEHSGIIVATGATLAAFKVVSKWGPLHEVLHLAAECPYMPSTFRFYRAKS